MNEIVYKKIMNYATLAQKMAKSFRIVIIHTLYKKYSENNHNKKGLIRTL